MSGRYGNYNSYNDPNTAVVYTDGACSNNGRYDARAGYGIYWGPNHPGNVSAPVYGRQTNNCAEYQAVDHALSQARWQGYDSVVIRTDSNLLIKSVTQWANKWERNGWRTADGGEVQNRPELESIRDHMRNMDVRFEFVPGHSGVYGNEQANRLAQDGARKHYY